MPLHPNSLHYGDNLDVLRNREDFPDESIDLIYLDSLFNSKRDYNIIYKNWKIPNGISLWENFLEGMTENQGFCW